MVEVKTVKASEVQESGRLDAAFYVKQDGQERPMQPGTWAIGLDPERDTEKVLLVVADEDLRNPLVWTVLGFTDEQSRTISQHDDWWVVNAPRPIGHVGMMEVTKTRDDGTEYNGRDYLSGESNHSGLQGLYPDAPFAHGRFYVAGDPTWWSGGAMRRTMAEAWKREADAWPVTLTSVNGIRDAYIALLRQHGEEPEELVKSTGMTVLEGARAYGLPVPEASRDWQGR